MSARIRDDQTVAPIDLRRLLNILHFGHAGMTKMETEAKIFWWPTKKSDRETKVKTAPHVLYYVKTLNINYQANIAES